MLFIADGALTLVEIVAEVSAEAGVELSDDDQMDIEEIKAEEPVISRQEAQSALNLVRRYVEHNIADPVILKCTDQLDEAFYKERKKTQKQTKLTTFFSIV